jgi:signal peptidase II
MHLYEFITIFNWFQIRFVENEGMAFGISFGENTGKLLLTVMRVGVVSFLIYYLHKLLKKKAADWSIIMVFSLIIAGALGNIIDSLVYGVIFNDSTTNQVATLFPAEGGYAPVFFGRVVDMFYFPLFRMPDWIPGGYGGEMFFPAIFNVADVCVTSGILLMLIFNKRVFAQFDNKKKTEATEAVKTEIE